MHEREGIPAEKNKRVPGRRRRILSSAAPESATLVLRRLCANLSGSVGDRFSFLNVEQQRSEGDAMEGLIDSFEETALNKRSPVLLRALVASADKSGRIDNRRDGIAARSMT